MPLTQCALGLLLVAGRVAEPPRHRAEAAILKPDSVAERATPETLTEHREISANPLPTMLAPDTGGKCVRRTQTGEAT